MHAAMFDFAWSEIALIGVVALIAIGPKDLPVAIKAVAGLVKKARKMAGEFQVHVDEMVREADLHEVRQEFNDLRRMDIKGKILNAMDGDGTLRKTMAENPLAATPGPLVTPPPLSETPLTGTPQIGTPLTETAVSATAEHVIAAPDAAPAPAPPAFIPPDAAHAAPAHVPVHVPAPAPVDDLIPSMIPPPDAKQPPLHA